MFSTIDAARLRRLAEDSAATYASAEPFPHIVFDDFLPKSMLEELQKSFPEPSDDVWGERYANPREVKMALRDEAKMPEPHLQLLREWNSQAFVDFVRTLTGIPGLVPDPDLYGGGLHQIMPGGVLKIHADFNMHPVTRLQRRVNVLLYLNDDWDDSYGGFLEMWDKKMTRAVERVAPIANRVVVFSTTPDSYHGHPDPLTCPPDRTRRSMAWYYYTAHQGRVPRHTALWQARPGEAVYTPSEATKARIDRTAGRVMAVMPQPMANAIRNTAAKRRQQGAG
jgi:hypothetical protein